MSGYRAGIGQTGSGVQLILRRLKHYDEGFVRHPVFGNRRRWVKQGVAPYKFSNAFYKRAPAIREVVNKSVQEALNEVARSV